MNQEKLAEFNKELSALLEKYGVDLKVNQMITVMPRQTKPVEVIPNEKVDESK